MGPARDSSRSLAGGGPHLAVVVVNYASHELLERNLGWPEADDVSIYVVDALSSMSERRAVRSMCGAKGWDLVEMPVNPGFGAAANAGARRATSAGCDTIVFLNPDASVGIEGLRQLGDAVRGTAGKLVAPRIVRPDGSVWFCGASLGRRSGIPTESGESATAIDWLTGACLATSIETWEALGGFDEAYFMYWEDVDLSFRCAALGGSLVVLHGVTVVHDVGATQGSGKSPLYMKYNCRNRLLFAARNLPRSERLSWLARTPRASWLILRRAGGRRTILASPRLVAAAIGGTFAGVLALVAGGRP